MAAVRLLSSLPLPKNQPTNSESGDFWSKALATVGGEKEGTAKRTKEPPPYGKRSGFVPRKVEDFGDGGAFPEIHVAQYPLDMGRKENKPAKGVLPLNVDAEGNIAYDAVVRQGGNARKIVHSQHKELVPKLQDLGEEDLKRPGDEEIDETTQKTKEALEKIVNGKLAAAQPKNVPGPGGAPTYVKYTPTQQGSGFNSGAKERVIRMVEMPVDPLDPPKFKHKRVPRGAGSPPVPVMHSPPRPVTVKDQADWKIPPCISNWKNPKGYTIPLDKRLAADGRGLQEVQINDNFAKLSEALYVAEQKAREAVEMRSKIQRELMLKEKEKRESELRQLAQRARLERAGGFVPGAAGAGGVGGGGREVGGEGPGARGVAMEAEGGARAAESKEERQERMKREAIRQDRMRERDRERRLDAKEAGGGKRSKLTRDRDRDVSEKIALGMASTGAGGGEVMYDQRLFNQEQGMESGFAAEDSYNVYDKGLFSGTHPSAGGLYRPRKDTDEELYGEAALEKISKTDRFRADKGFAGASDSRAPRDKPVEFEKTEVEADPFGLDQWLTEVKKGKKAMDKIGGGGTMRANAGGAGNVESYQGAASRSHVNFERGRQ